MAELDSDIVPRVGILDYGMGNLRSVLRAFQVAGADAGLVSDVRQIDGMDALVFPGQGAIVDTMRLLNQSPWADFIRGWIAADKPFFGICLGLQALFEFSEEGDTCGLGIFPGRVRRFIPGPGSAFKVPHMGWNSVEFAFAPADRLLAGLDPVSERFYFVHSYYVESPPADCEVGITEHAGVRFVSALRKGALLATQFHPEKSQLKGLQLYRNFLRSIQLQRQ